jgi:subtilisin family serine protease
MWMGLMVRSAVAGMVTGESDVVPGRYIVIYKPGMAASSIAGEHVSADGGRITRWHAAAGLAIEMGDAAFAARIGREPEVQAVLRDRIVRGRALMARPIVKIDEDKPAVPAARTVTGDLYYTETPQEWAVLEVGGYGASVAGGPAHGPWDLTMGKGVRIAVLDSGVDETHPDVAPNLVWSKSEVDQTALPSACDNGSPQDQQGHGTWVASLAAAALGADTGEVVGVAPQASLLNIKVLERVPANGTGSVATQCEAGEADGLLSWVLEGIADAVEQRADVIVMSLGVMVDLETGEGAGLKASFDQAAYAAEQSGAILVAAAGNDGFDYSDTRYVELPAQARGVLAVVASTNPACAQTPTQTGSCVAGAPTLAYYSNYGAPLDAVAAPGGSYPEGPDTGVSGFVRGACSRGLTGTVDGVPSDGAHSFGCFGLGHQAYVQAMGTSAAAPLVAGVAALLRAAHPEWDAATIVERIRATAVSSPAMNYGIVNAAAALGMN